VTLANFNGDAFADAGVSFGALSSVSVAGDPLQRVYVTGGARSVLRWGMVPGAAYDVIRGDIRSITQQAGYVDLGSVICLANDTTDTDTATLPDDLDPAGSQIFFYLIRPVVGGVHGNYTVSTNDKIGSPSSGDCD